MHKQSSSLRNQVYETVLRLGEASITQVLGEIGRSISAAAALAGYECQFRSDKSRGHSLGIRGAPITQEIKIERGRRILVKNCLIRLCNIGKLRRVGPSTYAPLLPKIFKAG